MTEFEKRLYKVFSLLWADSNLLCIIWSYKDTLGDDEIIEMLDERINNTSDSNYKKVKYQSLTNNPTH